MEAKTVETYEEKDFGGKMVRQRVADGYVSATDMCKANGKLYADWYRLDSTSEYLRELSSDMGTSVYFFRTARSRLTCG